MQIYNCEHCNNKTQCTVMRVKLQNSVKICRNSKFVEIQNLSKYKICRNSKFVEIQNLSNSKFCQKFKIFHLILKSK